jgi:hypothetical protein
VPVLANERLFTKVNFQHCEGLKTARSGDCNNSVIALRGKPFKGSFSGLPYEYVRIICTDDGKESLALV